MTDQKHSTVLIIVGPTASGKSRLALCIAGMCQAEIVSADSRQIYKYMTIGTDKPSIEIQKQVPHHCIDIAEPTVYFSAGEYAKMARPIVADILSRKKLPIVVGGSGLYIQCLVDGVFEENHRDPDIRDRLKKMAKSEGLKVLYQRLCAVDPEAAQRIHANDEKRIIRALEVYELTGKPISQIQKESTKPANFHPAFWGLQWPRNLLYERINARVDHMIESGLVDEVRELQKSGFYRKHNAMDSVGYKEIFDYLDGLITLEEAVDLIKKNTRRFAKKQMTWFRRESRIQWIDVVEPADWKGIAQSILQFVFPIS